MAKIKGKRGRKSKKEESLVENDSTIKTIKKQKVKKMKQTFKDVGITYETQKIILKVQDEMGGSMEIVKEYEWPIRFGKFSKGSKTEYMTGKFGRIMEVITDEKDLTYIIFPIN